MPLMTRMLYLPLFECKLIARIAGGFSNNQHKVKVFVSSLVIELLRLGRVE